MNLSQLINLSRALLDEPDDLFYSDEELTAWLNEGQVEIANRVNHLTDVATADINIKGKVWTLPDNFIKEFKILYNDKVLPKIEFEEEYEKGYFIWGDILNLNFEIGNGELKAYYYRTPELMEEDNDNPEVPVQYRRSLIDYALYKALQKDEKYQMAESHKRDFMETIMQMVKNKPKAPRKTSFKVQRRG